MSGAVVVRSYTVITVLFISNLFPRPDAPRNGAFNLAFVAAMHARLSPDDGGVDVLVPVPEWRFWRWRAIRRWTLPTEAASVFGAGVRYVPCFYLPIVGRSLSFLWYAFALRGVMDYARGCDAVVASWLYPDAVAASYLATRLGRPCWIRLHGSDRFHLDAPIRGRVCQQVLSKAAGVMVNAVFMKKELVRRGIPETSISVVRNGIDRTVFNADESQALDAGLILWVGNMVPIKRPDLAMRAFAALVRMYVDSLASAGRPLHLVLAGEGPMRRRLESLARRLRIENQVSFPGSLSRREVASWMRRASVLLLTSRSEGMPNVVIEALACGTPVVSTAVGDVPDIVQDGSNGFVVRAQGAELPHEMANALMKVLHAQWDRDAIQASVDRHDWGHAAETALSFIHPSVSG